MKRLLFLIAVLAALSFCCFGDVIHVESTGSGNPNGSPEYPYAIIQDALDNALAGDTVLIHPGTYTGIGNRDLSPEGKDISITGTDPNDPATIAQTIIDCEHLGRGFFLLNGETNDCIIEGLTITNGHERLSGFGSAIYCIYSSNPTIRKCIFFSNFAPLHGGALGFYNSDAIVSNCLFYSNTADGYGGAIFWRSGKCTIQNCIFADNFAALQGGAIRIQTCPDTLIANCTIVANESANGGGIHCWQSDVTVENCILWSNTATENPQIGLNSTATVSVDYTCIQGGWLGTENFDADPLFAAFSTGIDPADYDFHLRSEFGRWLQQSQSWVYDQVTSLCIDAGNPAHSYGRETWPNGKRPNIGAYATTPQASMNGNRADFNIDGSVDYTDMIDLAVLWLSSDADIVNLDSQGLVDMNDMAIFTQNWQWTKD